MFLFSSLGLQVWSHTQRSILTEREDRRRRMGHFLDVTRASLKQGDATQFSSRLVVSCSTDFDAIFRLFTLSYLQLVVLVKIDDL